MRFSAALGNMSKLYCTRLHENSAALGIARKVRLCSRLHENFLVYLFAKYLQIAHAAVQVLAFLAEVEVEAIAESNLVLPRAESHA